MASSGPIIIVDDDIDDQEIIAGVLHDLQVHNKQIVFSHCKQALLYLQTTTDSPFFIICDINMPAMNGLELKRQIDADAHLRQKSIPFIFFSTSASQQLINEAYSSLVVQGFFQKQGNVDEIRNTLRILIEYWQVCKHPNM